MTNKFIQHGDVDLFPIAELPKNLKKIKHDGEYIIAHGEQTGHAHQIKGNYEVMENEQGERFLKIVKNCYIEHWNTITRAPAEHKTLPLTAPFYKIGIEDDFNPITEEIHKTKD